MATPESELISKTAVEIRALLGTGEITPGDLLDTLARRIDEIDDVINALPTLCLDRARESAHVRDYDDTLLGGIPIAIKDLDDVEGVRTTYGSRLFADHMPSDSGVMVRHIEANGGIVYAKSNTPEFGTGGNTRNDVFGATVNPWNTTLSAAGSSGGAAAALASGTAWLAQGSDMAGSLRNPASFCNVVGFRPTVGRVASDHSESISNTLSTSGPMARNVSDLALLMDAMSGHEPGSPLSLPLPCESYSVAASNPASPGKIAFSMDLGITPVDPRTRQVISQAIDLLSNSGWQIEQCHPDFTGLDEVFDVLRAHSYARAYAHYVPDRAEELDANVLWNIERGLELQPDEVHKAEAGRVALAVRVQQFFAQYPALLCPATVAPAYPVVENHLAQCDGHEFDNYYRWLAPGYAFTTALCPALSLPCGFTADNLPVGLQIASGTFRDASVISLAAAMEKTLNIDTRPIEPRLA